MTHRLALATTFALAAAAVAQSPTSRPSIDADWADLALDDPQASAALLRLSTRPAEAVALFKTKLLPLNLTPEEVAAPLIDLSSPDEPTWRAAYEKLDYFDPRLAVELQPLFDSVDDPLGRPRLVALLSGRPVDMLVGKTILLRNNSNFFIEGVGSWWAEAKVERINQSPFGLKKPTWTRAVRAMVLLEHLGTADARAIVDAMATGHPDAQPTRVAKDLIAARSR